MRSFPEAGCKRHVGLRDANPSGTAIKYLSCNACRHVSEACHQRMRFWPFDKLVLLHLAWPHIHRPCLDSSSLQRLDLIPLLSCLISLPSISYLRPGGEVTKEKRLRGKGLTCNGLALHHLLLYTCTPSHHDSITNIILEHCVNNFQHGHHQADCKKLLVQKSDRPSAETCSSPSQPRTLCGWQKPSQHASPQ